MLGKAKNIWTRTWSMARAVAQAASTLPRKGPKGSQTDENLDIFGVKMRRKFTESPKTPLISFILQ